MGDPTGSTVTLEIQGVPLECNRTDLIQHSDYFRAMLEGSFIESGKKTITLNGIEVEAMKIILKLLWDNEYIVNEENILSVLQASCMLQFLQIKDICLERLEQFLSVNNCLKIWQYTEHLDLRDICHKAKLMALLEFMFLKDTSYFLELNLEGVADYLGNVYLQCLNEFTIFESVVSWLQNSEERSAHVLLQLLHCVDFNAVTIEEICEMILNPTVSKFDTVCDILKCVISIKNSEEVCGFEVEHAKSLLRSQNRNHEGQPCILVQSIDEQSSNTHGFLRYDRFKRKRPYIMLTNDPTNMLVAFYDVNTHSFEKLFEIEAKKCENLDGFKIASYKNLVFLFGGEFLLGKGDWNLDFYIYDVIKEKWKKKRMPFSRRHFESCISGKYLYIVAGTGPFRVIQENIYWYDIEEDEWSCQIKLPCSGRQIKCCAIENRLFVLNVNSKCGYIFSPENQNWTTLSVCDPNNTLPFYSEKLVLFYYKKILYIRSPHYLAGTLKIKLLQLSIKDNEIMVVKDDFLPEIFRNNSVSQVESVLCGNILYTANRHSYDESKNQLVSLELLNVDTYEVVDAYEKMSSGVLEIDGETFKFKQTLSLFSVFHPNFLKRNDLIN